MTVVRSKFHARQVTFENQLEETTEFEAIHTSSLGNNEVLAYHVTSQELHFRVELGETYTAVKTWYASELGCEVAITVHPTRVLEGLQHVKATVLAVQQLKEAV